MTFSLSAPATLTLAVERRAGRRWKATRRRASVQGRVGTNRATVSLKGLRADRYRLVARAGTTRAQAGFRLG